MQAGKLPQDLLARLLRELPDDPKVLLGPGIGRDAAAVDLGDGQVLVAATDPVTFATDQIGRYAVFVNANDVACLGARPAWFLATALLPEGSSEALAAAIFQQIRAACEMVGSVPIGGHTEISLGIERPLIAGTMLGVTTRDHLVRPEDAGAGDHVILANGIAIEGTAVLAREVPDALRDAGVPDATIASAAALLEDPGISIVAAAQAACATGLVHALHDPTEGGLATALEELALGAGVQASLRVEEVPILAETREICAAVHLDPLGLLASGALLVAAAEENCVRIIETLSHEGVSAACIANLESGEAGVIMDKRRQEPLPRFERDELARFLEAAG